MYIRAFFVYGGAEENLPVPSSVFLSHVLDTDCQIIRRCAMPQFLGGPKLQSETKRVVYTVQAARTVLPVGCDIGILSLPVLYYGRGHPHLYCNPNTNTVSNSNLNPNLNRHLKRQKLTSIRRSTQHVKVLVKPVFFSYM